MSRDRPDGAHRGPAGRRDVSDSRAGGRVDQRGAQFDRIRIAQAAARLIADHGISDWALAKRKAARQLMLPETGTMPSNDDIVQALTEHHALFAAKTHAASLRTQREEGLAWMRRLAAWEPLLVGGVAAGWAGAHSDVRLELVADDPKSVEIALASEGIAYTAMPSRSDAQNAQGAIALRIDASRAMIRLTILTHVQRRNRPRRHDVETREPRLSIEQVEALLG